MLVRLSYHNLWLLWFWMPFSYYAVRIHSFNVALLQYVVLRKASRVRNDQFVNYVSGFT